MDLADANEVTDVMRIFEQRRASATRDVQGGHYAVDAMNEDADSAYDVAEEEAQADGAGGMMPLVPFGHRVAAVRSSVAADIDWYFVAVRAPLLEIMASWQGTCLSLTTPENGGHSHIYAGLELPCVLQEFELLQRSKRQEALIEWNRLRYAHIRESCVGGKRRMTSLWSMSNTRPFNVRLSSYFMS